MTVSFCRIANVFSSQLNQFIILSNYHFVELKSTTFWVSLRRRVGKPKKSKKVTVFSLETHKIPKIFGPAAQSFFEPFRRIYHFVELSFCWIEKYENLGRPSAGIYHFVELSFTCDTTVVQIERESVQKVDTCMSELRRKITLFSNFSSRCEIAALQLVQE